MWSPLHEAASSGNASITDWMLKEGASAAALNAMWEMPLHIAARQGHLAVCQLLHMRHPAASVYPSRTSKEMPMHQAALNGQFHVVTWMAFLPSAQLQAKTQAGQTVLDTVIHTTFSSCRSYTSLQQADAKEQRVCFERQQLQCIGLLSGNAPAPSVTFQMLACASGTSNVHIVLHLLQQGADPNYRTNPAEQAALHRAALAPNASPMRLLLKAGAKTTGQSIALACQMVQIPSAMPYVT